MGNNKKKGKKNPQKINDQKKDELVIDLAKNENIIENRLPFVSICTPTFNRRPFISSLIKCFDHQDYPKDRIEWIIIDDGTDKIGDLVKDIPQVKYYSYNKKLMLGKKRNIMHEKCKGDILVYMDDDDYYPPQRISHAVERLLKDKNALCAGSSEIYIFFKHINEMYQFGPYKSTHSTAGTFAFKRELLKLTRYDDNAALAEEKHFLKNYTIPFVQLDPIKTILVFSHIHNTFDKRRLLDPINPEFTKKSTKTVDNFIKEPELFDFFVNQIEIILKDYEPGRPNMKPDVLSQMVSIEKERRKYINNINNNNNNNNNNRDHITFQQENGPPQQLTLEQVVNVLKQQQQQINNLTNMIRGKEIEINILNNELMKIKKESTI